MAHKEQIEFCRKVKDQFPEYFIKRKVLDCGSLDINGNNRYLFEDCDYTGIDLVKGKNVDIVCPIHLHAGAYDTIICTEVFEHDMYFEYSVRNIINMLNRGGLFLMTCAYTGRGEHGTKDIRPESSPATNDYYQNRIPDDFFRITLSSGIRFVSVWKKFYFEINNGKHKDLYLWGIKG